MLNLDLTMKLLGNIILQFKKQSMGSQARWFIVSRVWCMHTLRFTHAHILASFLFLFLGCEALFVQSSRGSGSFILDPAHSCPAARHCFFSTLFCPLFLCSALFVTQLLTGRVALFHILSLLCSLLLVFIIFMKHITLYTYNRLRDCNWDKAGNAYHG